MLASQLSETTENDGCNATHDHVLRSSWPPFRNSYPHLGYQPTVYRAVQLYAGSSLCNGQCTFKILCSFAPAWLRRQGHRLLSVTAYRQLRVWSFGHRSSVIALKLDIYTCQLGALSDPAHCRRATYGVRCVGCWHFYVRGSPM